MREKNPEISKVEAVKPVGRDRFQISFSMSEETEEKMKKLKGRFAHTHPNMTTEELFEKLLELGLEKLDPATKAARSYQRKVRTESKRLDAETPTPEARSIGPLPEVDSLHAHETVGKKRVRSIPADTQHEVWVRNQNGGCEFANDRGERCGSQSALQVDHVLGFARGGAHEAENLRVLSAKHNRFVWKMNLRC